MSSKKYLEDEMKKGILITFLAFVLFSVFFTVSFAQTTTTTSATDVGAFNAGLLAIGQDNLYLAMPGEGAFLAVGAGMDIASWEKDIGKKGGKLSLALHPTAAAKVTGGDSSVLVGTSINIDLVKLLNGTGIKFLLNNFKCVIGPVVVYDVNKGKPGYGGLLNFSYTMGE
jgi:hypothetical protein